MPRHILCFILFITLPALAQTPCQTADNLVRQQYAAHAAGQSVDLQEKLLRQALQLCPDHPEAHNNIANLFEAQGAFQQAIRHYQQAIQAKTDFAKAWYGLGETYYKQGRFAASLEAHLHACKTDKDSRERVKELLRAQSYAVSENGTITDKADLLLLFDPQRRAKIDQMLAACGMRANVIPVMTFRNLLFDTGRAELKAESQAQVDEIAAALSDFTPQRIKIHGHTDRQPFKGMTQTQSDQANLGLSRERAATVKNALIQKGIPADRIVTDGFGPHQPVAQGDNEAAYSKNRRVEISVE